MSSRDYDHIEIDEPPCMGVLCIVEGSHDRSECRPDGACIGAACVAGGEHTRSAPRDTNTVTPDAQMSMFSGRTELPPVSYHPRWFCETSLDAMVVACQPEQYRVTMYGRVVSRPRLESWFHDDLSRGYVFGGGAPVMPKPWPRLLDDLRRKVSNVTGSQYNSCFVNLYRHERDSIAWHADDESWIGPELASVSLGAARTFRFRRKSREPNSKSIPWTLYHGDLFVMRAGCQLDWEHSVPKQTKPCGPRLNMTFRQEASP